MGEEKRYTAFQLPQREIRRTDTLRKRFGVVETVSFDDAEYAEIEFGSDVIINSNDTKEGQRFSATAKAQAITQRKSDPIREKFCDMRSLAYGNHFVRNDAVLFYKQAKFMEGFTDNYSGGEKFSMYYPLYQYMGYKQLRTYFTWRTKVRRGEIIQTSLSYVFLYIYELLSCIGVANPAEGLDKLLTVWTAYREHEPALDDYLPRWIKHYHIYYELHHSFADFVVEHNLNNFYPELFFFNSNTENRLALWNSISGYDITKSKFYNEGNDVLCQDCFDSALNAIQELCTNCNIQIGDLFSFSNKATVPWYPFERALFWNWLDQPDRTVRMHGGEVYHCKDNRWTAKVTINEAGRKELAGYLLKKTEACLRHAVKYRYKISVNPGSLAQRFRKLGISFSLFNNTIEEAVTDFHKGITRTVVSVDHANLARIRKEALGTQDKLIVPDDEALSVTEQVIAAPPIQIAEPLTSDLDGWLMLKEALSIAELEALRIVLDGGTGIKAFADENGVMLEVLIDSINEKAADCIGDSILEIDDNIIIYDEYRDKITEMAG